LPKHEKELRPSFLNYTKQTKRLLTRIIGKISALTVLQDINKQTINSLDKLNMR